MAKRLDPRLAPAWLESARVHVNACEYAPALADYKRFLELDPRAPDAADVARAVEELEKKIAAAPSTEAEPAFRKVSRQSNEK
jgi:hypothetical protein